MDLAQWRSHIDQVVADEGQWVGIADENGLPILELGGLESISFPENRLEAASAEVVTNVSQGDRVLAELVGDDVGRADVEGRLVPANGAERLLVLERPGERRAGLIVHSVLSGDVTPSKLRINAVDLLDGLSWWPCPSIPVEWLRAKFSQWSTDASGERYKSSWELAQLQLATRADGYTKQGPAVSVIRELVQDSFDAVNGLYGWSDPHAVVEFPLGADGSPEVTLRVNDDPVWDTVSESARSAGVGVEVNLWWPGDAPVRVRSGREPDVFEFRSFGHPVQVVRVQLIGEQ